MLDKLISNQANVFLDYGCGDGTLICELVRALGKEDNLFFAYDAYTSPNLPPEYDIEVLSKQMIDSPLYMEKFSSICLIHTLEHALFPGEMLMDIYNLLQPSGKLLIQVPNWKYNPFDLVIADHYHHFSIPTLCSLLLKSGFNVLHTGNEISWKEITVVAEKIVRREF
jgi:SAM-dependent methyltransferase